MDAYSLLSLILNLATEYARRQSDPKFQLAADAVARLKQLYADTKAALQQSGELTDQQSSDLDAQAEASFASDAADPNKNA
jgi:hypothetical protein